jgi:hypothetical protein
MNFFAAEDINQSDMPDFLSFLLTLLEANRNFKGQWL